VRFCVKERLEKLREMHGDEESFFDRLGDLDRMRWLVHEASIRKIFGVKQIDDGAFEKIRCAHKAHNNISTDPPSYCILQNPLYQEKLEFTPFHFQNSKKKKHESKEVVSSLLGLSEVKETSESMQDFDRQPTVKYSINKSASSLLRFNEVKEISESMEHFDMEPKVKHSLSK